MACPPSSLSEAHADHTDLRRSRQARGLRVALLHHHLRPGGVTTVLREQFLGLSASHSCIVLSGEPPGPVERPDLAAAVRVLPGIAYDEPGGAPGDARRVAAAVRDAMLAEWGTPADILHVHNALLARNAALPAVLAILQEQGIAVLVQVHDLAEDGRPHAYRPHVPYPDDCHYAIINSRDREALLGAGLRPEGLHLLANPVRPVAPPRQPDPGDPAARRTEDGLLRLLYPVRGIRRKNVGEALLLALLLDAELSVTLPPRDPADLERWDQWQGFAREHGMRVRFGAGMERGLGDLLRDADCAVSTSLNEGFGYAFLEPWTSGRRVAGRRIAHATADIEAAGALLPHLYGSLAVPCGRFDCRGFAERWAAALSDAWRAYGREVSDAEARVGFARLAAGDRVDFGALDETAQRQLIAAALSDRGLVEEVLGANPHAARLRVALRRPEPLLVEGNRQAILSRFGPGSCARELHDTYRAVIGNPVRQSIDRAALLDRFLSIERFRMLEAR